MSGVQTTIVAANALLLLATIVGLAVRRRFRGCVAFALYLTGSLAGDVVLLISAEVLLSPRVWLIAEAFVSLLRFLTAVEVAVWTFRAFPRARARAGLFLWLIALAAVASALARPSELFHLSALLGRVLPRLVLWAGVWLFTGLGALVLWYRIPVEPLHKAILMGFVPYLLVFTAIMSVLNTFGWVPSVWGSYANTGAYLLLLVFWTHAVWRRAPTPRPTHGLAERLAEEEP